MLESCLRDRPDGDRLELYLDRLAGFRDGVEDQGARAALADAWNISEDRVIAFAEQGLGMVQVAF